MVDMTSTYKQTLVLFLAHQIRYTYFSAAANDKGIEFVESLSDPFTFTSSHPVRAQSFPNHR
jgi:hypothetical protein